jgi:NitT/TauT family transport system ATP-binding protein
LRILLGLDRDFDGLSAPTGQLAIGMVEPRLLAWRNVEENIRLVLGRAASRPLDTLLADVGLAEWRNRYPAAFAR